MRTNKEIIDILIKIEQEFDVNKLLYKNIRIWPFLRYFIIQQYNQKNVVSRKNKNKYSEKKKNKYIILIQKLFRLVLRAFKCIIIYFQNFNNQEIGNCDILFLSKADERSEVVNNKWYNPHCDSFFDLFEENFSINIIEFSHMIKPRKPAYNPCIYIDNLLLSAGIKHKLNTKINSFFKKMNKVYGFRDFIDYFKNTSIYIEISEKKLTERLDSILSYKKLFEKILIKAKPGLLFLVCYYYDLSFSAILACNSVNVASVEFQHGAQNDYNFFLTNWSVIPKEGYTLLPDYYWNWGVASADRINKWADKTINHKAFVGGNLWLSKWINDKFQTNDCFQNSGMDKFFPPGFVHILISLQVWPEQFPNFMFDVIKKSPPNWFWHLREHPRQRLSKKELEDNFLSLNTHIESQYSTSTPLYFLLRQIDFHITGFSTVAFEAASFNIPTIFFHKIAKDGYQKIIDDNAFFYADNYSEMKNTLSNHIMDKQKNTLNSDYIIIDKKIHRKCLSDIISETKRLSNSIFQERNKNHGL